MFRSLKFALILLFLFSSAEAGVKCGKVVSLLGAAGSAKGTQGEALLKKPHGLGIFLAYSGGNLLRQGIINGDPDALEAKPYMDAGKLSPSHILAKVAEKFFRGLPIDTNLILDGSPRKLAEYESITAQLKKIDRRIDIVIFFDIDFETSWDRVSGRQLCPSCQKTYHERHRPSRYIDVCEDCTYTFLTRRPDDLSRETVLTRWQAFQSETMPVVEKLKKLGIVVVIDGKKSLEEVEKELIAAIKNTSSLSWKFRRKWHSFKNWLSL